MNRLLTLLFFVFIGFNHGNAQRSLNKLKGDYVRFSALGNFQFDIDSYLIENAYRTTATSIEYEFVTPNSGTFEINEIDSIDVTSKLNLIIPSNRFSFGASVQIIKQSGVYHEFSLLNISQSNFERVLESEFVFLEEDISFERLDGFNVSNFNFAYRYEGGFFFRNMHKNRFNFGLGGGLEQSFRYISYNPLVVSNSFPINVKSLVTEFDLIPSFYFFVSSKIFIEIKSIIKVPLYTYENLRYENPSLTLRQQRENVKGEEANFQGSIAFKFGYLISKPERSNRKRR